MIIEQLHHTRKNIRPCLPPQWAKSGHAQTIFGHLLDSPTFDETSFDHHIPVDGENEFLFSRNVPGEIKKIVYLFHGLGGSSEATYMLRTARVARSLGYHVFMTNHRGCGKGAGLAREPYHSGRGEDLSSVIKYGRQLFPEYEHIAVGFSLSANALLLLSSGARGSVLPDKAIAVNAPINLEKSSVRLTQGLNLIYNIRFMNQLRRYIKLNRPEEVARLDYTLELRGFDDSYTAPLGGFKNRSDYYEKCSAKAHLSKIKIPTVIITAHDDPFVGGSDYLEAKYSENVVLHMEKVGGHMGYLGQGIKDRRWLDYALNEYLAAMKDL